MRVNRKRPNISGVVLVTMAVGLSAFGVEPVFREDFAQGRLTAGGRLMGEAEIVDCVFGKALKLPGKSGSFARYPAGELSKTGDFTLTMWFRMKPRTRDAKGNVPLNGFAALDWAWWFDLNRGVICGHFSGPDPNGKKRSLAPAASIGNIVSPDEWTHAALVYSPKAQVARIFVNGVKMSEFRGDPQRNDYVVPLDVAAARNLFLGSVSGCHFSDGEIARVRIYPGALTAEEIATREEDAVRALGAPSLAEVGRWQRTGRLLAKDRKLAGGKDIYWGVVDPMGYAVYFKDSDIPAAAVGGDLRLVAAKGEYEPASFLVRSLSGMPGLVPVVSDFRTVDGKTIPASAADIRIVKQMIRSPGGGLGSKNVRALMPGALVHDDACLRVDEEKMEMFMRLSFPESNGWQCVSHTAKGRAAPYYDAAKYPFRDAATIQPLDLPAGRTLQYWVTVHVPDDAAAGLYRATVRLMSKGAQKAEIPVLLRVLPYSLPEPRTNYDLSRPFFTATYYRHYPGKGNLEHGSTGSIGTLGRNERQVRAELRNLREHGYTSPGVTLDISLPRWISDADHYLYPGGPGHIEDTKGETREYATRFLRIMKEEGMRFDPLYIHAGRNLGFYNGYRTANNFEHLKEVKRLVEKFLDEAVGTHDAVYYGIDEASGKQLEDEFEVWRDMKKLGLKSFTSAMDYNVKKIAGRIETINTSGRPDRKLAAFAHSRGTRLWNYAHPFVGMKEQSRVYRVNYGLMLYLADYDGLSNYAWNEVYGFSANDYDGREYAFVILTADGVLDTPSWEGQREGIDDIRYATKLRQEIDRVRRTGAPPAVKEAAEQADAWLGMIDVDAPDYDPQWVRWQIIDWTLKLMEAAK